MTLVGVSASTGDSSQDPFTDRELTAFDLVARGETVESVATRTTISTTTVKNHLRNVAEKIALLVGD